MEGQTIKWPKEKGQKGNNDLQNTTHKTKDQATQTPLKIMGKLWCSGRVSSSCSTLSYLSAVKGQFNTIQTNTLRVVLNQNVTSLKQSVMTQSLFHCIS